MAGNATGKARKFIKELPWGMVVVACLTLGLAPFSPPHIWEKLRMLIQGTLVRPLDWFDLLFHGAPWVVLVLKVFVATTTRSEGSSGSGAV